MQVKSKYAFKKKLRYEYGHWSRCRLQSEVEISNPIGIEHLKGGSVRED